MSVLVEYKYFRSRNMGPSFGPPKTKLDFLENGCNGFD
jgi:hypothetical protein